MSRSFAPFDHFKLVIALNPTVLKYDRRFSLKQPHSHDRVELTRLPIT